jgi:hypothetical protein
MDQEELFTSRNYPDRMLLMRSRQNKNKGGQDDVPSKRTYTLSGGFEARRRGFRRTLADFGGVWRSLADLGHTCTNFILKKAVRGALVIVLNPTKWAVVLVKGAQA